MSTDNTTNTCCGNCNCEPTASIAADTDFSFLQEYQEAVETALNDLQESKVEQAFPATNIEENLGETEILRPLIAIYDDSIGLALERLASAVVRRIREVKEEHFGDIEVDTQVAPLFAELQFLGEVPTSPVTEPPKVLGFDVK
jgi:hypothetical protein